MRDREVRTGFGTFIGGAAGAATGLGALGTVRGREDTGGKTGFVEEEGSHEAVGAVLLI